MTAQADIVIFGSGSFAARIALDIAATARTPVRIAIAGRNAERLAWLRTAGNARATIFGTPARFASLACDLAQPDAAAGAIAACRPRVVVQAASSQTSSVIARSGDRWSALVAEGGLSATAVFQAHLTLRVARAVPAGCQFINCCFPDVVNGLVAAAGLPVACGTGNVAILSNAFAGEMNARAPGALRVLAHYQTLGAWRRAAAARADAVPPRVWLGEDEVAEVFARFAAVKLTPEPAIEISGAAGAPLMLAMVAGGNWRGHAPGPFGLPGGYPVRWDGDALALDLPAGLTQAAAVAWNAQFEARSGLVVEGDRVRYTGALEAALRRVSPDLAGGYAMADIERAQDAMAALRSRLEAEPS